MYRIQDIGFMKIISILSCFLLIVFISIQVILKCCYELNILGIDMSSKSCDMLHERNK